MVQSTTSLNTSTPRTQPSANRVREDSSADQKQEPSLARDATIKLASLPENNGGRRLTVREANERAERKTLEVIRNTAVNGTTAASFVTIILALISRFFSSDPKQGLAAKLMNAAKATTKATFMTYGGFAACKGYQENDAGVALTQALEVAIPAATVDPCNLTTNRGLSIGLGNFIVEAKKLLSKSHYENFGESIKILKGASAKMWKEVRENPLKAMLNFREGPGAMLMALMTASAPIIHKLTGFEALTRFIRHVPGMIQELGKANLGNLQRGASMYFTSGVLMMGSSLINLLGGLTGNKNLQTTMELCTWLPNVVGRRLLVESMRQSELAQDRKAKPVTMMEAFKESAKNIFGWRGAESPVVGNNIQPVLKQAPRPSLGSSLSNDSSARSINYNYHNPASKEAMGRSVSETVINSGEKSNQNRSKESRSVNVGTANKDTVRTIPITQAAEQSTTKTTETKLERSGNIAANPQSSGTSSRESAPISSRSTGESLRSSRGALTTVKLVTSPSSIRKSA